MTPILVLTISWMNGKVGVMNVDEPRRYSRTESDWQS
jgi:hypothetical protein